MDSAAETSPYSAEGIVDWYASHAEDLQGVENSDEYYSDDEYEEDPIDLKRTRKQVTGMLRSYASRIRKEAESVAREHFEDAVVGEPKITPDGVYFPIENAERPFELTAEISAIDPKTNTHIDHRKTTGYSMHLGDSSRTFQTWLIYDPTPLVRDYLVSRRWKWNAGLGFIAVLAGLIQLYMAWKKLSAYVDFMWILFVSLPMIMISYVFNADKILPVLSPFYLSILVAVLSGLYLASA